MHLDRNQDVMATLEMMTTTICADLRKSALMARELPGLSAERALNDAADAIERGLAEMLKSQPAP